MTTKKTRIEKSKVGNTSLRKGDLVMVIAGGNNTTRPNKGKVGKILRFVGKNKERVVVEGLNFVSRHLKARGPQQQAGKIAVEGSIHTSNVMLYIEKLKKPVRVKMKQLENGKRVRGYTDKSAKKGVDSFVQLD